MSDAVRLSGAARARLEEAAGSKGEAGLELGRLTTIGCGGPAAFFIEADSTAHLEAILASASDQGLPWFLLGRGSNLLVADEGWPGIVIRLTGALKKCSREGERLDCGAGITLSRAAAAALDAGLSGLEPLAGIPGSVGGAVAMNAGAFGAAIGDLVQSVEICLGGETAVLDHDGLEFGYRSARLPAGGVVARAMLKLKPAKAAQISNLMSMFSGRRASSQPVGGRTCGSVFKNPPGEKSAGELLELAGCKGERSGGAIVSPAHANFIVNEGGAKAADVLDLMNICRRRVHESFGVVLEPEVRLLGGAGLDPLR